MRIFSIRCATILIGMSSCGIKSESDSPANGSEKSGDAALVTEFKHATLGDQLQLQCQANTYRAELSAKAGDF